VFKSNSSIGIVFRGKLNVVKKFITIKFLIMKCRINYFCLILLSTMVFVISGCEESKKDKKSKKEAKEEKEQKKNKDDGNTTADLANAISTNCDSSIWKYVYDPERLDVIEKCVTVTGIVEESSADEDGDQHMLLKLDQGQESLINKKNQKEKNGYLVIEAVCVNKTSLPKVGGTCKGYVNHIKLPKVGDHVKVTGSYVIDTHNGWAEIHPITKIEAQ
jgi:hypothetical protein